MRLAAVGLALAACAPPAAEPPPPRCEGRVGANPARDITRVDLDVAWDRREGHARVAVGPGARDLTLDVGDLDVRAVRRPCGEALWQVGDGRLDVGVSEAAETIEIDYRWRVHEDFDGAALEGWTFTWPDRCGNLFPCHPNGHDGVKFGLTVSGVPAGQRAIYPPRVDHDAPPYMLAWAIGPFVERPLGQTRSGRRVSVFAPAEDLDVAAAGARGLVETIDLFEGWFGPYPFGSALGTVAVPWPDGAAGGMEHHPFWHVATPLVGDVRIQRHEAAHGWFGNDVRIACPEDLVLSEGVAEYLTVRATEAVDGPAAAEAMWDDLAQEVVKLVAERDTVALPDASCGAIHLTTHPLWSRIPYLKGAFFLRAVEVGAGRPAFDRALAAFWAKYQGRAARMRDLIDALRTDTGYDTQMAEARWLRSTGFPAEGTWRTW